VKPRGNRLTVVVYPWSGPIDHHHLDSRDVSFWRRWAAAQGAGFINLFPAFSRGGNTRDAPGRWFLAGDGLWGETAPLAAENILRDDGQGF